MAEVYETCEAYVASNPKALQDAFWDFVGGGSSRGTSRKRRTNRRTDSLGR